MITILYVPVWKIELGRLKRAGYATWSWRNQILRTFDASPRLPAGYPTMILLALIPPLWRKVMDPRVQEIRIRMQLTSC